MQDQTGHYPRPAVPRPTVQVGPAKWALLLTSVAAIAGFLLIHWNQPPGWFDDVRVYAHGYQEWQAGRDPYSHVPFIGLYFLYPPIFLYLEDFLVRLLSAPGAYVLYVGLHITAVCALPLLLARYYFRLAWLSPWFALLVFFASPRFTGMLAFVEMNVASCLYLSCLAAAVPGFRRNRWKWFYLAVFLAAMIKPPYLALLLLPLCLGTRQWIQSGACVAAVALANLGEKALWPDLYRGYLSSLAEGILAQQTYGYGVFGILATYHRRYRSAIGMTPYLVSGLLVVLMIGALLLLRRRLIRSGARLQDLASNGIWLALVLIAAILVNPRQMKYDMDIALFAGFVLWVYVLRTRRLLTLLTLLFLPSLFVPLIVLNPHMQGMYETFLVLAVFALGCWRLWQEPEVRLAGAEMELPVSGDSWTPK